MKEKQFDVYISYASEDQPSVELIAERLRKETGLEPWFDKWHLIAGTTLQEAIETALQLSSSCAVFIGRGGLKAWHQEDMRIAIQTRVSDPDYRVIPVLLPNADLPERGGLPPFLARHVWVDFRKGIDDPYAFHQFVSGIKGIAPNTTNIPLHEAICPYLGLQSFQEEHAQFFFGRSVLVQWLIEDLRKDNLLVVIGPSGSGKSSVVRAGLIPALRQGAVPSSAYWPILTMRPGNEPVTTLVTQLLRLLRPDDPIAARHSLTESLKKEPRELARTVDQIIANQSLANSSSFRILLIVDQFEEIFTLCSDVTERTVFIDALLEATRRDSQGLVCVLTLRADFYSLLAAHSTLGVRLERRQRVVSPMDVAELRQAIEEPAKLVGLRFEKGLINTILDDTGHELGVLPLLEHTLWGLWQQRRGQWLTFDAYETMGGVKGALAKHAEEVFFEFSPQEQTLVKQILLRLTQPGEYTEDTRRRANKSDLISDSIQGKAIERIIQKLTDQRLLIATRDDDTGQESIDISHEALIRGWPRLTKWVEEDKTGIILHNRLSEAAKDWEKNNRNYSYLYRGARLVTAKEWTRGHKNQLSQTEQLFLNRSIFVERRRRIMTTLTSLGATAIIAIIASLALTGELNRWLYRPYPMEWVEIPEGIFIMGSSETEEEFANNNIPQKAEEEGVFLVLSDEVPAHKVHLDTYEINRYEVTNREYRQCVNSTFCSPSNSDSYEDNQYDSYPITDVNWQQALQFCEWIGGNLPTEAQWEKAARGPEDKPPRYPWGDEYDPQKANVDSQSVKPVGSYSSNVDSYYGTADMAGNVWEWVRDYYAENYYNDFKGASIENPTGPENGETHTLRGGSYDNDWIAARVTNRSNALRPGDSSNDVGFRCIRIPQ